LIVLIALMKDQVDNLKTNGIGAEYINSTLSFSEIEEIKKKSGTQFDPKIVNLFLKSLDNKKHKAKKI